MNKLITTILISFTFFFGTITSVLSQSEIEKTASQQAIYPFSTDSTHLTMWNGFRYVPFFIKGMNLGISIPGTYPGELAATKEQYREWFAEIKEAGYNVIRLYTLHYPRFYETLNEYNSEHPDNPLYFIQGVWLEEELPGYNNDLFYISAVFKKEIEENIDCVHGNKSIGTRLGKAYGDYTVNVSKWMMAYLIGREVSPLEVQTTNTNNVQKIACTGTYLSIANVHATEIFITERLDSLLIYEQTNYGTQRPVAFSSWPTLDPLTHPSENQTDEDTEQLELAGLDYSKAKAGFFVSYHAYPYYPDFVSRDSLYQNTSDEFGPNPYLAYLIDLKHHYTGIPLLIAEVGVPSSWGVAHYSRSGMNHGGNDELQQGQIDLRLLKTILDANCGGGIQFAWIDEWFKRTWICDPFDFPVDNRVMWQNVTSAEQNFGLIGFRKDSLAWDTLQVYTDDKPVKSIAAAYDHAFFNVKLDLNQTFNNLDTLWVAFDTYNKDLGEKRLLTGDLLNNGAEFLLRITNDAADLYVTEAYDLYGIWHGISTDEQLYHSTLTTGAPWKLVRWKNNSGDQEIQYIGHLKVNRLQLPSSSMDAITMLDNGMNIKIPWSLLQFVNPGRNLVMDDDKSTAGITEVATSDGIGLAVKYKDQLVETSRRFNWSSWNNFNDVVPYKKASYFYMKQNICKLPGLFIAVSDHYLLPMNANGYITEMNKGVLYNDVLLENFTKEAMLVEPTTNGFIQLSIDGTFTYIPDIDFYGVDSFSYKVVGESLVSDTAKVEIDVAQGTNRVGYISLYPNPASDVINIRSTSKIDKIEISDVQGKKVLIEQINNKEGIVPISNLSTGTYFVTVIVAGEKLTKKLVKK